MSRNEREDIDMLRKDGIYARYIKRALDIVCSGLALILLCWLYAIIAILVRVKLGSPVIYRADRQDGSFYSVKGNLRIICLSKWLSCHI